jgi:ferrous iron transport protein A
MALADAPARTPLTLVTCLIDTSLRTRLATLGLRTGSPLEVVLRTAGGGRVVSVAGSRIAMDRSVLQQLHVKRAQA